MLQICASAGVESVDVLMFEELRGFIKARLEQVLHVVVADDRIVRKQVVAFRCVCSFVCRV